MIKLQLHIYEPFERKEHEVFEAKISCMLYTMLLCNLLKLVYIYMYLIHRLVSLLIYTN